MVAAEVTIHTLRVPAPAGWTIRPLAWVGRQPSPRPWVPSTLNAILQLFRLRSSFPFLPASLSQRSPSVLHVVDEYVQYSSLLSVDIVRLALESNASSFINELSVILCWQAYHSLYTFTVLANAATTPTSAAQSGFQMSR